MNMPETPPKHLTIGEDHASYRPRGTFTFEQVVDCIDEAIEYCRTQRIGKLLVNILDVKGVSPPTTAQRFSFAATWAKTAAGKVDLAMVAPEHLIDREKIGVMMARNRGLETDVFTNEEDARKWLKHVSPT